MNADRILIRYYQYVALALKEWVGRVFDGPVSPNDARLTELEELCKPDLPTLQRLAEVFENVALFEPYSDESVNQALWDLSGFAFVALTDESIEWAVRWRLVSSFETLFREFFAVRCRPILGHLDEEGSPLNSACYMWWDFNCWYPAPDPLTRNRLDSVCLAAMRAILAIDHVACQEGALHGLGHWHRAQPAAVEDIIDEYLQRSPRLRRELRAYADSARAGYVL